MFWPPILLMNLHKPLVQFGRAVAYHPTPPSEAVGIMPNSRVASGAPLNEGFEPRAMIRASAYGAANGSAQQSRRVLGPAGSGGSFS